MKNKLERKKVVIKGHLLMLFCVSIGELVLEEHKKRILWKMKINV